MQISYSRPLSAGWNRMKKALFQPFDINKWVKVGFTAWLAGLTDCGGGSGSGNSTGNNANWDEFFNFPQTAWDWLLDNPVWANLILVGLVILFIIISVVIWVSSRGRFMFLHNVAHDKAEISKPWHDFRKQGNSLFIFQFFWSWFAFAVFALIAAYSFITGKDLYLTHAPKAVIFAGITQMVLLFIGYLIVFGYISLFLKDFVVPIMYKHRVGVIKGWGKFLLLFGKRALPFILYGLFIFVLGIAVGITIIFFALITCCIGLLLIAIPYIGAVILLPISYTFRAFSIEFLAQFGDKYNVFPPVAELTDDRNEIAKE
ncbi:hypothetical protein SAMN05444285_10469 [Draconibacterium orientale]|uniref:DUF4013 domain-containing protein n=2 Tax=Draconibacterium orientale TaxID=1168034 RepID=A0A1I0ATU9_9BACT|nr:hypothetical protein [Draconibacterium orientale]SES97189.1 hypothetical protein SAMN05444285_10469 [Draconibacterium orientale]